jgi:hypothetical protein
MPLINQTIPGLYGGVSQQAPELRHDTQVTEMINCYPTVVGGLQKRPPSEYIYGADNVTGPDYIPEDAFVYMYERDDNETYAIFIKNVGGLGSYRIYDLYNKEWAMLDWEYQTYLDLPLTANVKKSFAASTVGDTTYVVNKTIVPEADNTIDYNGDEDWEKKFFYWVKRTAGGSDSTNQPLRYTYYIINQAENMSGTATANNSTGDLTDSTTNFAGNLVGLTVNNNTQGWKCVIDSNTLTTITTSCNTNTWAAGDEYSISNEVTTHDSNEAVRALSKKVNSVGHPYYSSTYKGSVVRIEYAGNTGIELVGSDSWGNQAHESWGNKARKLQDLPNELGYPGTIVELTGDDDSNFDNYYVKYEDGVYKETFRPGIKTSFNASTMPQAIAIARDSSGNYVDVDQDYTTPEFFRSIDWGTRQVGDDDSAGFPSFIEYGKPIQDVFFYRNRLGFIAGDNVILSEVGGYYNFFPTTVTDVLDSDMIDVAVDSNQSVLLKYAIPFNKELLIFGNNSQYVLSSGDTLTPKKVSVQQSTAYNISNVKPVGLGPNVYFGVEQGDYSALREYYVQPDSLNNIAANVTAHCPSYVRNNIKTVAASNKNDMVFVLSSETPDTIYTYNFYWQGEEKVQSAWHKWTFAACNIHDIQVVNGVLYLFTTRGDNSFIEKINLELPATITDINYEDMYYYYEEDGITLTRDTSTGTIAQGTGVLIDTTVTFTPVGFTTGQHKIDDKRNKFILKNIQINADFGSFYGLEVLKYIIPRKYGYTVGSGIYPSQSLYPAYNLTPHVSSYNMTTDGKYPFSGKADALDIKLTNDLVLGFRINSIDFLGNFVQKSRSI